MAITVAELLNEFSSLISWSRGPKDALISNINSPLLADGESLVFIPDEAHLKLCGDSRTNVFVVQTNLISKMPTLEGKTLLMSPNPKLVMAMVGKKFFPVTLHQTPVDQHHIHPSAIISKSAKLGADIKIGPGAVIGDHVTLGSGSIIGANSVIEPRVSIGARTHIHPLVFIGHHTQIGEDCEIKSNSSIGGEGFGYAHDEKGEQYRVTHYGKVVIEDRVHIGSGVQVDRGTFADSRIGAGTKIDNHCHFGHNIEIGKNTVLTGGTLTAGSAKIGSYCVVGGRTTISGHISIADKTQIAGLSGVSKTISEPGAYGGYPLQKVKDHLKTTASMATLPALRKQVAKISKKLGLESEEEI